ncbi:MAG: hypothetical protein F6K42_16105 [Leptolyngbya sp. SIO1D8]|nr:hypothetical protein [Leptolyngbya sp. SIO1D8]
MLQENMSSFTDQMLLQFLQNTFVEELLENELGLENLFNLTYETEEIELQEISLSSVKKRQFQVPAFETIYTAGTEERILPEPGRLQVKLAQPRYGRLTWVEVFLGVLLTTKVHNQGSSIESITTQDLFEELGEVNSIDDLRNKLEEHYPESIVDAFFEKFKINSIEEFKKRGNLFINFFYKEPPPFDPNNPGNSRNFHLNICVNMQSELKISEAIQAAKFSRSILENEQDFAKDFEGGEVKMPYIFVTIFPESLLVDEAIPGLTAIQIKEGIENLFLAEGMLAHFFVGA